MRYKRKTAPIQPVQISLIKMAKAQLGIDDDDYYDKLMDDYGVKSCTHLDFYQASRLIKEYQDKGFVIISKKGGDRGPETSNRIKRPKTRVPSPESRIPVSRGSNVVAIATADEIDKVNKVAALIPWRETNGLELFLIKRMGIKSGKVRTSEEAYLAIEGLKKMFENGMKKAHGKDWWTRVYTTPAINRYIEEHCPAEWR